MVESANTSATQNLLTARNAILISVAVLALSLLWALATMLRPKDSGGLARDSFGTHGDGFRGLFETLQDLNVPVTRGMWPPSSDPKATTVVMLAPDPQLVQFEPKYLTSLKSWVERGGRLIVAPQHLTEHKNRYEDAMPGERNVLKLLDIEGSVTLAEKQASDEVLNGVRRHSRDAESSLPEEMWDAWTYKPPTPRVFEVEATGSLKNIATDVHHIAAPGNEFSVLVAGNQKPSGSLSIKTVDSESILVAAISHGKGEIIVVSDPALLSNFLLARSDNSILAAKLLAPRALPVDFDEYYHGLSVRGNPLFLLTRPGFAAIALGIVLVIAITAWRSAVFLGPPLADGEKSRRDIQEYIHAMGAFFVRGPGHRRFLVQEIRNGVLHELCEQLHLPPHTTDVDVIASALRRRDPQRAEKLQKAVADVDARLAHLGEYPRASFFSSMQQLTGCL